MKPRVSPRIVVALALAVVAAALPSASAVAASGDVGFRGPHFSGTGTMVTGQKPESKLWFNDGHWWASMWDEVAGDNFIYRLDRATHTWVNTGVMLDNRAGTRADCLWDGTKLYVASHGFTNTPSTGFDARLYRYSYDASTDTYALDAGFPAAISNWKSETLVIDKDSTGKLWATWVAENSVYVNTTTTADNKWGTPFVLPVSGATGLNSDDISSVVSYRQSGATGRIGVMWSHQNNSAMYFAEHVDGDADTTWQASRTAVQGPNEADDHINLKSLQADGTGRIFAAVKTEHTAEQSPLVRLLVRDPSTGDWASHTFGRKTDHHTRPIVLLDGEHGMLYMFATSGEAGGTIYYKSTPVDAISFEQGLGTPFMHDPTSADINDATSTKQTVNSASGIVVMASDDTTRHYWHNELSLGPVPLDADFSGSPTSGSAPLAVAFSDRSAGSPTSWAWNFGDGTTSTAQNPAHTYSSAGTYTVTLTVGDASGATNTETKAGYVTVGATAPLDADFSGSPTSGSAPLTVSFSDTSTGSPVAWSWNFGDGTTSTEQHPTHSYSSAGAYTVALTVSSSSGSTSTETKLDYVTVTMPPPLDADFTATPTSGSAPLAVAFSDKSSGTPTSWRWDFGDGTTSTEQNPSHTYASAGTYTVSLTAADASGATSTETKTNLISVSPPSQLQSFFASADAYTKSNSADKNYGNATSLRVKNGGTSSTAYHYFTYIKFSVTNLSGSVTGAKLRLYVVDPATRGGEVYAVSDNSWTEPGITWANQPAMGSSLAAVGPAPIDTWVEVTLPASHFTGNGTYTLGIRSNSASDGTTWFSSREGARVPELRLTTG